MSVPESSTALPVQQHEDEEVLEPESSSDVDSVLDESSLHSLTTSVTSSVFKYREEYGRTYHNFKDGQYPFPNDAAELDRLDLEHAMFLRLQGDKLFLAPISVTPQNVLDVGTGTGIWAVEFADLYPSASVVGTDLSPTQPGWVPPNLQFELDDANGEWTYSQQFDFVHCRELQMAVKEKRLFQQALAALKPGGWFEIKEITIPLLCDDGTTTGTAVLKWCEDMLEISRKLKCDFDNPYRYRGWMEEAGFVNVEERHFPLPVGTWPKDKRMKQIGQWERLNFTEGLEGFSLKLFTEFLGWSRAELELFLVDVRKDLANPHIHAYMKVINVIGQKPLQ